MENEVIQMGQEMIHLMEDDEMKHPKKYEAIHLIEYKARHIEYEVIHMEF